MSKKRKNKFKKLHNGDKDAQVENAHELASQTLRTARTQLEAAKEQVRLIKQLVRELLLSKLDLEK